MGLLNGAAVWSECGCIGGTSGIMACSKDPCKEKVLVTQRATRSDLKTQNEAILAQSIAPPGYEHGADQKLLNTSKNNYKTETIRSNTSTHSFLPNFSLNSTEGYSVGASHGHPAGSGPSPKDVMQIAYQSKDAELVAAGSTAVSKYKAMASATTMTVNGNYVITAKDWPALCAFQTAFDADENGANDDFVDEALTYQAAHPTVTDHEATVYAIIKIYGSAINVYKASPGSTTYTPLTIVSNIVTNLLRP
ncbi:hypothetical protein [Pedobacter steynii]